MGAGGVRGPVEARPLYAWGGREGEMELGGVGRPALCFLTGKDLAATVAKLSLPAQKLSRGLRITTDSVIPAKAKAMLELVLVLVGAMSSIGFGVFVSLSAGRGSVSQLRELMELGGMM